MISRDALSSNLTQIFLFAECVNARVATALRGNPLSPPSFPSVILEMRKRLSTAPSWKYRDSEIVSLILHASPALPPHVAIAKPDSALIDQIAEFLLRPCRVERLPDSLDWRLRGPRPNITEITPPDRLTEDLWFYSDYSPRGFATRAVCGPGEKIRVGGAYCDESISPLALLDSYLIDFLGIDNEAATSVIQRWIRRQFLLRYTEAAKHGIPEIARRLNQMFYSKSLPLLADFQALRSATVTTGILLHEIAAILGQDSKEAAPQGSNDALLLQAVGILLFLRHSRALRVRHHWIESDGPARRPREEELKSGPQHCISALRTIEASSLLARMFGSISNIPGLNFLFRGGIVPRTSSGRTFIVCGPPGAGKTVFALQKLTGVASRGGLGVYFSFEESYDQILDRLVTFGLADREKFIVVAREGPAVDHLPRVMKDNPGKGILYLYGSSGGESEELSIVAKIAEIGEAVRETKRWRAVAIDSVNALDLGTRDEFETRRSLQLLIETIEGNQFLGILITEPGGTTSSILSYLADTIIDLGHWEDGRSRWLEIKKCRSQSYHPGKHPCQLQEGRGMKVYPSIAAVLSELRRRAKSTLSEERSIPLLRDFVVEGEQEDCGEGGSEPKAEDLAKEDLAGTLDKVSAIAEKSSTLIYGPANSSKTDLAFRIALGKPVDVNLGEKPRPSSLLVVTFRTTERHFEQDLRASGDFLNTWNALKYKRVRWYSPGSNISGEHILSDLRTYIQECRRLGAPLERIVFDELESAEHVIPALQKEPLFWSTLIQLVGTEAITSVFVFAESRSAAFKALRLEVDYIFRTQRKAGALLEKFPDLALSRGAQAITAGRRTSTAASPSLPKDSLVTAVIQIDGRVRKELSVSTDLEDEEITRMVLDQPVVREALQRKAPARIKVVRRIRPPAAPYILVSVATEKKSGPGTPPRPRNGSPGRSGRRGRSGSPGPG